MCYRKRVVYTQHLGLQITESRMSIEKNSTYERRTFPELRKLAVEVPEAGIHLQSKDWYFLGDYVTEPYYISMTDIRRGPNFSTRERHRGAEKRG